MMVRMTGHGSERESVHCSTPLHWLANPREWLTHLGAPLLPDTQTHTRHSQVMRVYGGNGGDLLGVSWLMTDPCLSVCVLQWGFGRARAHIHKNER